MRALAAFIMAGRLQAVTAAVGFSVLALLFPPAALLSGAVVALVALRLGVLPALTVVVPGGAALAVLVGLAAGQPLLGLSVGAAQWLPVLALALVLRRTVSWTATLQAALLLGAGVVAVVYGLVHDPARMWLELMEPLLRPVFEQSGMPAEEITASLEGVAQGMTGAFAASLSLSLVLTLLLARAWQAALYHPGGFRSEFHSLRVGRWPAALLLALLLLGAWAGWPAALELAMVGLAVYFVQGVAVMHGLAARQQWHKGWLVGMYVLLALMLVQMATVLAALGVIDSFADIRQRLAAKGPGGG